MEQSESAVGDEHIPEGLEKVTVISAPIKQLNKLDSGSFSIIYRGELTNSDGSIRQVAVKEGKSEKDNEMLVDEAKILAELNHTNVIKLLGIQSGPLRLIFEYMERGNLEKAVQNYEYTDIDMLKALHDVASGLEYISEKKYIHRDLACKNVFVDSNKLCKLGDFGLSEYFGDTSDGLVKEVKCWIRIQSAPPESQKTEVYSTKSDVWAYGVFIWEFYSLRDDTYYDYSEEEEEEDEEDTSDTTNVVSDTISDTRYPRPPSCSTDLFDYVKANLFNLDPQKRPDFTSIKEKIGKMLCPE